MKFCDLFDVVAAWDCIVLSVPTAHHMLCIHGSICIFVFCPNSMCDYPHIKNWYIMEELVNPRRRRRGKRKTYGGKSQSGHVTVSGGVALYEMLQPIMYI